ncbi:M23 family metallopeptidase [Longirhabdus pacifica]|uniref:M23 family metallopeptidase n=1 Tax=Longirhabdus pacifica TaxID=2305227 RepID=UPI0010090C77|nr:M23 family metallopeptidase [Longirhabdus pacifica]
MNFFKRKENLESFNQDKDNNSRKVMEWIKVYRVRLSLVVLTMCVLFAVAYGGYSYVSANVQSVYHTYFNGEYVGALSDPEKVEAYVEGRKQDIEKQYEDYTIAFNDEEIEFEMQEGFKLEAEDDMVLSELDALLSYNIEGYELVVDGEAIAMLKNQQEAEQILERLEQEYTSDVEKQASVENIESVLLSIEDTNSEELVGQKFISLDSVEIIEDVDVEQVSVPLEEWSDSSYADPEELFESIQTGDVTPVVYEVQQGDCISCIATDHDIPRSVIYDNNEWIQDDKLQIGDQLDLTIRKPKISVKTVKTENEIASVHYDTIYEEDEELLKGQTEIIQQGQEGMKVMTFELTYVNNQLSSETVVNEEQVLEPVAKIVRKGTKVIPGIGSGMFSWPVSSPNITSYYGHRWGSMHKGLDMTSSDKNIYAADSGTVVTSEYHAGYGNYVVINHNNGYQTLYAHLSQLNVSAGTNVEKGTVLGIMGTTGNSTGVHLHFEVKVNGTNQNPSSYLN